MENLMDIKQAATILAVKESWIRSLISQRKINHIKMGGLIRLSETHLEELVKINTRPVKDEPTLKKRY